MQGHEHLAGNEPIPDDLKGPAMNAEEKVRAAWARVTYREPFVCISTSGGEMHDEITEIGWPAAAAFTDDRLKQVAEIEEEIGYLSCRANFMIGEGWENHVSAIQQRTLARLQAIREELRRGMK